jgi:hypothetical protein
MVNETLGSASKSYLERQWRGICLSATEVRIHRSLSDRPSGAGKQVREGKGTGPPHCSLCVLSQSPSGTTLCLGSNTNMLRLSENGKVNSAQWCFDDRLDAYGSSTALWDCNQTQWARLRRDIFLDRSWRFHLMSIRSSGRDGRELAVCGPSIISLGDLVHISCRLSPLSCPPTRLQLRSSAPWRV